MHKKIWYFLMFKLLELTSLYWNLTDYFLRGSHFYAASPSADLYFSASSACFAAGGQLAVVNTDETVDELIYVMNYEGNTNKDIEGTIESQTLKCGQRTSVIQYN